MRSRKGGRSCPGISIGEETHVTVEVGGEREEQPVMVTVHDPVCGMDIDPADAAGTQEFEGSTYYLGRKHLKRP